MRKYDAAVFDLDGTLLNTLEDLADSANDALCLSGYPPRSMDEVCRFVGNGVAQLIHLAVPEGTDPAGESACLARFRAHYLHNMSNKTAPYPGVPALLDRLSGAGYALAVVSNKFDGAVKALCRSYFGSRIPVAIGESDGAARKPAPDMVRRALAELGVPTRRAVYIGDSDVDLLTAQNSGLPCIAVSWGFRDAAFLRAHGAAVLVNSIGELEQALLHK